MATIKQLSTLLIVDDKPDNLFILQEVILQHLPQCETVTACSTQDGLEVAALKALDGALIDVQMPGMDGVEMCRRLKADPKTAYVPVILITSHRSSPKERAEGLEAGADDFISRPIDNIELVARINTILRMKRAEDQLRTGNADLEKRVAEKTAALSDRVKELNCLYAISSLVEKQDITLEEILQGIVGLVPPALQHPELTCARITLDGQAFKTENFSETARRKISDIVVHGERLGSLQVCCLGEKPKSDGCLFLKEEKGLIDAVAGRLGKIIERKRTEEEKKRLKAHLRQAQKMEAIGSLAGGIAHDFNNVLCPIIGYTELTLDSLPEGSKAVNYLNEVLNAAMRAKDLVQQILTFSRQSDPELKPLMVQPIVKETLKLLRASIPATIKITPDIDKNCSLILADPTQIHQLIVNLCTNAYHAMREKGGLLKVSLKETEIDSDDLAFHSSLKPGHYLQLGISDTGHGMDRSVMERIFDPYFTTKAPGEGTGLGLAVVHGIVKNYGGDIRVYSEPGEGSTFHIYLPLIRTNATAPETTSSEPITKGTERILLVDDEEPVARIAQQMLEHLGYSVTAQTGSMEALETFQMQPDKFDLVITDQTMPNMTGAQLAQKLLGIRPDIPIILCTGFSEMMTEEKARAIGIRELVMKPVVKGEISKVVRNVLEKVLKQKPRQDIGNQQA